MKISIISNTLTFISKYYNRENSEYRVLFSCMNDQQSIDLKDLNKLFQRFLKIPFFLQAQRKRFGFKDQRGSVSKIFRDERKLVKLINRRQADVRGTLNNAEEEGSIVKGQTIITSFTLLLFCISPHDRTTPMKASFPSSPNSP